jgi:hypothetical protein
MTKTYCPEHYRLMQEFYRLDARFRRHLATRAQRDAAQAAYYNHNRTCTVCRDYLAWAAQQGRVHPHDKGADDV